VSRLAGLGDYSITRPACHAEILLRIYSKKSKYFGLVQTAYRAVLADLHRLELEDGATDTRPTTPVAETPSSDDSMSTLASSNPQRSAPKTPTPAPAPPVPTMTITGTGTTATPSIGRKRKFAKSVSIPEISSFGAVPADFAQPSPPHLARKVASRNPTTTPSPGMLVVSLPGLADTGRSGTSLADIFAEGLKDDAEMGRETTDDSLWGSRTRGGRHASLKRGREDDGEEVGGLFPAGDGVGAKKIRSGD